MDQQAADLANIGPRVIETLGAGVQDLVLLPGVIAGVGKKAARDAAKPAPLTGYSPFDAFKPVALISLKARSHLNTAVDTAFYDVAALDAEERRQLTEQSSPEGGILILSPSLGTAEKCHSFKTVEEFKEFKEKLPDGLDTVVVAGVGSSFLGTAALARSVANVLERPVAGVVSGYGLADLVGEGLGGWFGLGTANAMARVAAGTLGRIGRFKEMASGWTMSDTGPVAMSTDSIERGLGMTEKGRIGGVEDSDVLAEILQKVDSINNIVGHSKGNFVLENALKSVTFRRDRLRVLTLGAPVYFPPDIRHYQVLGGLDLLGLLNTRASLRDFEIQPFATHVVKPGLFGLDLATAMDKAGIR